MHIYLFYPLLITHQEREQLQQLQAQAEDALLFIRYHSSLLFQSIQQNSGYEWSMDEFLYSDECSLRSVCTVSLFTFMEYWYHVSNKKTTQEQ